MSSRLDNLSPNALAAVERMNEGERATMTDQPDYTTMSGAEFQRAVGADPERWAEAFMQRTAGGPPLTGEIAREYVAAWFRDFAEAAARADERRSGTIVGA